MKKGAWHGVTVHGVTKSQAYNNLVVLIYPFTTNSVGKFSFLHILTNNCYLWSFLMITLPAGGDDISQWF